MSENYPGIDALSPEERDKWHLATITMRPVVTAHAIETVKRDVADTHPEFAEYLSNYITEHKGKRLYFAWFKAKEIATVFCPDDHTGCWIIRNSDLVGTGRLDGRRMAVLESILATKPDL